MFNLIVAGAGWRPHRDTFPSGRVLEFTSEELARKFKPRGILDLGAVSQLPTIFVEEGQRDQVARVGTITRIRLAGGEYHLEYTYDPSLPPVPNRVLAELSHPLGIDPWEFSRTHWAIKGTNLFHELLRHRVSKGPAPKVFELSERPIDEDLVSVMMPFDAGFTPVFEAISNAIEADGGRCSRADTIWRNEEIIQDIVELLCTSAVVVCDLSGRNANVFYEAGIAHTLGKDVILISQSHDDVPFDLRYLRYIRYLNNVEGRAELAEQVMNRIATIKGGR